jgi:hypothetical protein
MLKKLALAAEIQEYPDFRRQVVLNFAQTKCRPRLQHVVRPTAVASCIRNSGLSGTPAPDNGVVALSFHAYWMRVALFAISIDFVAFLGFQMRIAHARFSVQGCAR